MLTINPINMEFMMKRWLLLLVMILLVMANQTYAISQGAAQSLTIPPGSKANALGQAFVSIVDDASAMWWNPAGLGQLQYNNHFNLTHAQLVPGLADDVFYEYLCYSKYMENLKGSLGFSLIYVNYGQSTATNEQGEFIATFSSFEIIPALGYGTELSKDFFLGLAAKFVYVRLVPEDVLFRLNYITGGNEHAGEGQTFALDFGLLKKNFFIRDLNLGFSFTNFGPDMVYIDKSKSDPIPLTMRLGWSYLMHIDDYNKILFTMDANKMLIYTAKNYEDRDPFYKAWLTSWMDDDTRAQEWDQVVLNFGVEYSISDFYFRAGYISDREGQIEDPTYGFGLKYHQYSFDYAAIPQYKELPYVSKFTVSASF
jgi:hypothetical protein